VGWNGVGPIAQCSIMEVLSLQHGKTVEKNVSPNGVREGALEEWRSKNVPKGGAGKKKAGSES